MRTGKEIKNAIKGSGLNLVQAAASLGISRGSLYHQLNKADPDPTFIENAIELINATKLATELTNQNNNGSDNGALSLNDPSPNFISPKDELIRSLKQTIASQNITINLQAQRIAQLEDQVNATPARKSA